MIEFQSLLVPCDFSVESSHAARYACDIAERFNAGVTILYVLPPLRYDFAMTEPSAEQIRNIQEPRMNNARTALMSVFKDLTSNRIRFEVIGGEPADVIVQEANSGAYDGVVMSTQGAGAFRRWFIIGSVTAKVLHAAEHPVITSTCFEKSPPALAIKRIVCAIDLGPQSSRILCWAWHAAKRFKAELIVTHAAPPIEDGTVSDGEEWKSMASQRFADRVRNLQQNLHVEADIHIGFNHPATVISNLAKATDADLVVLGRGESHGLIGRLRANAYDIIRHCECPVVSV